METSQSGSAMGLIGKPGGTFSAVSPAAAQRWQEGRLIARQPLMTLAALILWPSDIYFSSYVKSVRQSCVCA